MGHFTKPTQWVLIACLGSTFTFSLPLSAHAEGDAGPSLTEKVQPYIVCFNRLAEQTMKSRSRYLSWSDKAGPTGKEKIIYGLYSLYDPADCNKNIAEANKLEPHDAALENAGTAFMQALMVLTPLVKEAEDYYKQSDYKDDNMAKGKQLHPKLMAGWDSFEKANAQLEERIEQINDQIEIANLAEIEKTEGRKTTYYTSVLMSKAKALIRIEGDNDPKNLDLSKITPAIADMENSIKDLETYSTANPEERAGSMIVSTARTYLTTAKGYMRRIRDKTPFNDGEKMMMKNAGSAWMVEGSPAALLRHYNELVERYNSSQNL